METLASSPALPVAPRTQTSHVRSSPQTSKADPTIAQEPTRSMQQAEAIPAREPPSSAPASQESTVTTQSMQSSVGPWLQASSSDISQLTDYNDLVSPTSSAPCKTSDRPRLDIARARTPEEVVRNASRANEFDADSITSPMSIVSPVSTNGAKRTASGHVKNVPSLPSTPPVASFAGRKSRTESISSTGSRAGELAASLKTRLGYAMAKVQHGWEHKSIEEVEQLAVHKISPNRHSMSHLDYRGRPLSSDLSNGTARLSMYERLEYNSPGGGATRSPPSKRHSGTYATFVSSSQPQLGATPRLQPAPDIRPTMGPQHTHRHSISAGDPNAYSNGMSPPRTPVYGRPRRPTTIRTETQTAEAERDALQALFQLGSPHSSQTFWNHATDASQVSSSQASPLRSEFAATPRKVTFARSESDASTQPSERGNDRMPENRAPTAVETV